MYRCSVFKHFSSHSVQVYLEKCSHKRRCFQCWLLQPVHQYCIRLWPGCCTICKQLIGTVYKSDLAASLALLLGLRLRLHGCCCCFPFGHWSCCLTSVFDVILGFEVCNLSVVVTLVLFLVVLGCHLGNRDLDLLADVPFILDGSVLVLREVGAPKCAVDLGLQSSLLLQAVEEEL